MFCKNDQDCILLFFYWFIYYSYLDGLWRFIQFTLFLYCSCIYSLFYRIVWYRDRIVSKQIMTSNANLEREDLVPFSNALTNLIAVHMLYRWSSVKMKIYRSKESKLEPVWDIIKRFRTKLFHWLIWIIQMWFVIRLYSSLYCYDP